MRLFVAVEVPAQVRSTVERARSRLLDSEQPIRWTRSETWHITLAFLGEVQSARRIVDQVGPAVETIEPVEMALRTMAGTNRSGVLWIELEPSAELVGLASVVRAGCEAAGAPADRRPLRPHLTLGRARGRRRLPAGTVSAVRVGEPRMWTARRVTLLRSHLDETPVRHETIAVFPLAGQPPRSGAW